MTITVQEPQRLDQLLAQSLNTSRSAAAQLVKNGHVSKGGKTLSKPSAPLIAGDEISVNLPEAPAHEAAPQVDFDVPVLYEDEAFLVINKPTGVVVHAAPSHKGATLVDWLQSKNIRLSTIGGEERSGIVHRIDKETTGALLIAKTDEAHRKLARQLESREMGRYYLAIIDCPLKDSCIVDAPVGRHPTQRIKMGVVKNGREAKSAFVKLADLGGKQELIAAKLFTGRTHQIRVHLQHLGRHIVGDALYGYKGPKDTIASIYLHAYVLYLRHPATGEAFSVAAPPPKELLDRLSAFYDKEKIDEILDPAFIARAFDNLLGLPTATARS